MSINYCPGQHSPHSTRLDGDHSPPLLSSLPKVAYALQTCPLRYIRQALIAFDDTIRESLADLAGGPLSNWVWLKASLPVSLACPSCLHWLPMSGELP